MDGERPAAPRRGTWPRASRNRLILGRRREQVGTVERSDDLEEPILHAYLERVGWEVGPFFGGVGADAPSEALKEIASDHPVFLREP